MRSTRAAFRLATVYLAVALHPMGRSRSKPYGGHRVTQVHCRRPAESEIEMEFKRGLTIKHVLIAMMAVFLTFVVAGASTRSDNAIRADIRRVLNADRLLDGSSIRVDSVSRGIVVLGGSAVSSDDIVRALRAAAARRGVRGVFSQIDADRGIAPPSGAGLVGVYSGTRSKASSGPGDAEDDVIRQSVTKALLDLDARQNADIRVSVTDGVVRLTGTVPAWDGNSSRMHAARSVTGVRSIHVVALDAERR